MNVMDGVFVEEILSRDYGGPSKITRSSETYTKHPSFSKVPLFDLFIDCLSPCFGKSLVAVVHPSYQHVNRSKDLDYDNRELEYVEI